MDLYTLWITYSLALYSLIYFCCLLCTLIYYTAPHILHHSYMPIIYSLLYTYYYILLYIFLYILSTLLYSNSIINLAPPFYTSPLSYILLYSLIYLPLLFLYSSTLILLYPLSYMEKGITTLPPIFTRFISLS